MWGGDDLDDRVSGVVPERPDATVLGVQLGQVALLLGPDTQEVAADDDTLAVRGEGDRAHVAARRGLPLPEDSAMHGDRSQSRAALAVDRGELAADVDARVGDGQGEDAAVRVGTERRQVPAGRADGTEVAPRVPDEAPELAADVDPATVGRGRERVHGAVHTRVPAEELAGHGRERRQPLARNRGGPGRGARRPDGREVAADVDLRSRP